MESCDLQPKRQQGKGGEISEGGERVSGLQMKEYDDERRAQNKEKALNKSRKSWKFSVSPSSKQFSTQGQNYLTAKI